MLIVIGVILMALAVGMFIARNSQQNKLLQIKSVETSQIKDLQELARQVAAEMGAGSFNQIAEVKGRCECESPLTSELAKVPCVYYKMQVSREYEETYWRTDANGYSHQETRRGSDIVASNIRHVPFYVNDGTGRIKLLPEGAEFIADKVFSQFQSGEVSGPRLSLGNLSFDLSLFRPTSGTRTLGYRYEEEAIQPGKDLYILGEAADSSGELAIQKPAQKKNKFIISTKSEEELIRSTSCNTVLLLVGSIISVAVGIALILLSVFNVIEV